MLDNHVNICYNTAVNYVTGFMIKLAMQFQIICSRLENVNKFLSNVNLETTPK